MYRNEIQVLYQIVIGFTGDRYRSKIEPFTYPDIEEEVNRIKTSWATYLFNVDDGEKLKRYVPYQQQEVLELADHLYGRLKPLASGLDSNQEKFLGKIHDMLLELHDFLFSHFGHYCNLTVKIPLARGQEVLSKLRVQLSELLDVLTQSGIDVTLTECIARYFLSFQMAGTESSFSYQEIAYVENFHGLLSFILQHENNRETTERVTEALIYLNYNHYRFSLWYQHMVDAKTGSMPNYQERCVFMIDELMRLNNTPVNNQYCFDPALPPITQLISDWLKATIRSESYRYSSNHRKLKLNLTVSQIGLFVRLIHDVNLSNSKSISEILRFVSQHFSSTRQEKMSLKSMKKAFYSKDQFTAAFIRDILLKMIRRINSVFFPNEGE